MLTGHLLKSISDIEWKPECDLTKFSTMRLKAQGDLIFVYSKKALLALLPVLTKNDIPYCVLGMGSNQILPEKSKKVFIRLKLPFDKEKDLVSLKKEYKLPASVPLSVLSAHAVRFGLKGWEVFTGIPATLGGALAMNAGTGLGEIGEVVKEVYLVDDKGKERTISVNQSSFSYRKNHFLDTGSIIVAATLVHFGTNGEIPGKIKQYLKKRNQTQPLDRFTCGCILKNHSQTCRAGESIDIIGLKGLVWGDAVVSERHANFLENHGEAQASDVKRVMDLILYELELNFGTKFEPEVKLGP